MTDAVVIIADGFPDTVNPVRASGMGGDERDQFMPPFQGIRYR